MACLHGGSPPLPSRLALHQTRELRSLGKRADEVVLRSQAVRVPGLPKANKLAAWMQAEKMYALPVDPHPPGTPPFANMGPASGYTYESARTMGGPMEYLGSELGASSWVGQFGTWPWLAAVASGTYRQHVRRRRKGNPQPLMNSDQLAFIQTLPLEVAVMRPTEPGTTGRAARGFFDVFSVRTVFTAG